MTAQPCDNLLDYYNGHLSQLEKAQFEKHLSTCTSCKEELFELRQLAEYLPYASDTVQPPEDLEDRVMASILGEEKKRPLTRQSRQGKAVMVLPFSRSRPRSLLDRKRLSLYSDRGSGESDSTGDNRSGRAICGISRCQRKRKGYRKYHQTRNGNKHGHPGSRPAEAVQR